MNDKDKTFWLIIIFIIVIILIKMNATGTSYGPADILNIFKR